MNLTLSIKLCSVGLLSLLVTGCQAGIASPVVSPGPDAVDAAAVAELQRGIEGTWSHVASREGEQGSWDELPSESLFRFHAGGSAVWLGFGDARDGRWTLDGRELSITQASGERWSFRVDRWSDDQIVLFDRQSGQELRFERRDARLGQVARTRATSF